MVPALLLRFAVLGDMPYDPPGVTVEAEQLARDVRALTDVAFVVHLGDLKRGRDRCTPQTYTRVAKVMCPSTVPVLVLPGDNEWNDCERSDGLNTKDAWRHWDASFGPTAERCSAMNPPPDWGLEPQVRPPRDWWPGQHTGGFRFDQAGVRFVGLALPSFQAPGHGLGGERQAHVLAVASSWVDSALTEGEPRAVVVFLHADVVRDPKGQGLFLASLEVAAREYGGPVLVITGDSHRFRTERPFPGVDLTYVVVTRGRDEAPLTVQVHPGHDEPFELIRGKSRKTSITR